MLDKFHGLIQLENSFLVVDEWMRPNSQAIDVVKCSLNPIRLTMDPELYPNRDPRVNYQYEWLVLLGPPTLIKMISSRIRELVSSGNPRLFDELYALRDEVVGQRGSVFDFLFITKDIRFCYFGPEGRFSDDVATDQPMWCWSRVEFWTGDVVQSTPVSGHWKHNRARLVNELTDKRRNAVIITQHTHNSRVVLYNQLGGIPDENLVSPTEGTPPPAAD